MKKTKYLIFGRWVKIKKVKGLAAHFNAVGRFHPSDFNIEIDADISGDYERLTIYHEIIHATLERAGLAQALPSNIQEIICEQMSTLIDENFIPKK